MLKNRNKIISLIIFGVGLVISLYLVLMSAWAGLEASLFASSFASDKRLSSLRCPVIITAKEAGTVKAKVNNPIERPIRTRLRASISDGFVTLIRQEDVRVPLEPDETQQVEWAVYTQNAVYDRMVLVRVYQFRNYPVPSRSATCGVIVFHMNWLSGPQLFVLILLIGIGMMLLGLLLWRRANPHPAGRTKDATNALTWLGRTATLGMLSTLTNIWILTGLLFLGSVLMIVVMLAYFIQEA